MLLYSSNFWKILAKKGIYSCETRLISFLSWNLNFLSMLSSSSKSEHIIFFSFSSSFSCSRFSLLSLALNSSLNMFYVI